MLVLILIGLILVSLYFYGTRTFDYWKKKGVKHEKPLPLVGNNWRQFTQQASMAMMAEEVYKNFPDEKVVGYFRGTKPELVIRDPEIFKRICTTDFVHFFSRGFNPHKKVIEPLFKNPFFADGDLWKLLRQRFSSIFSTAKLKAMFPLITKRAKTLQILTEDITNKDYYDARELFARFTTDFIGECCFGINMDALTEENSQFRKLGKRIFHRNFRDAVCGGLKLMFPELCKNLTFLAPELTKKMLHLYQTIAKERNYKPLGRNDFIDLLIELRDKEEVECESIETRKPNGEPVIVKMESTDMLMAAQLFGFFGAGHETSSTASSFCLHQLAYHPDCQEKVHTEIDEVLERHNNQFTYEAIKEMKYLDMALDEAMRMYPSVGFIMRNCTSKSYTIPELNLTIDEDIRVIYPVKSIHMDEKYYNDPEKYDPERFTFGTQDATRKFVYLPFGDGPRACVGERLGKMQSMASLAIVLQKFYVEPAACSVRIPKPNPSATVTEGFVGGLPLKFKKRITTKDF